jgi:sRNA-binding protein
LPPGLARVFDRAKPLPLAIGTHAALAELGLTEPQHKQAGAVIARWFRTSRYLRALAAVGAMRHDIAGTPVEPVSADHRARAASQLERRATQKAERLQQEAKAAAAAEVERELLEAAERDPLRARAQALAAEAGPGARSRSSSARPSRPCAAGSSSPASPPQECPVPPSRAP